MGFCHSAHEALDLQLSATGDAPVWGGCQTLPPAVTSQSQGKGAPLPSRGAECCPPTHGAPAGAPRVCPPQPHSAQPTAKSDQELLASVSALGPRTGSCLPCSPFPLPSGLGTASVYPGAVSSLPTEAAFFPREAECPLEMAVRLSFTGGRGWVLSPEASVPPCVAPG